MKRTQITVTIKAENSSIIPVKWASYNLRSIAVVRRNEMPLQFINKENRR